MTYRAIGIALVGILALGCGDDDTGAGDTDIATDTGGTDTNTGPICGDGFLDSTEECDGTDLGGASCTDLGSTGGTLACNSDCTFDKSGCETEACGNGTIDAGEECDGVLMADDTCMARGFTSGRLTCLPDCTVSTLECLACGNGTVDDGEDCDSADLGGETCVSLGMGFTGGTLGCDAACAFDVASCESDNCGNGIVDDGEDCDGADIGGSSCADVGFVGGTLACDSECRFDSSTCTNCGNGTIDGTEMCDTSDFGGTTCATVGGGFTGGDLSCTAECMIDPSACTTAVCGNGMMDAGEACDDGNTESDDGCSDACALETGYTCEGTPSECAPECGDGMIIAPEECDGTEFGGETCVSRGFLSGDLTCGRRCRIQTTSCVESDCGNGTLDDDETCDDGNTENNDGCSSECLVEPTFDLPVRLRNGDGSNHGMVEVRYDGEWRWVCDDIPATTATTVALNNFANVVCNQLGYTGTGHEAITRFGGGAGEPAMDDVNCTGGESSLAQCEFAGWERNNCTGGEAVGVRCVPGDGDIRLTDGPHGMDGRMQAFTGGAWGEVCDDIVEGWSSDLGYTPTTVCQQLGYKDGEFVGTYDAPTDDFAWDGLNCTGTETRVSDCPRSSFENCVASEGAGFRCTTWDEGDARLVGGTARNRGQVEILHNGVWGTVCDDKLEPFRADAALRDGFTSVVCGELGFSGTGMWLETGSDGTGPIWLDEVMCAGGETSLMSCPADDWGVNDCSHGEDSGVICTP